MATDQRTFWDGLRFALKWFLIGGGILFFGGLAVRAFQRMHDATASIGWPFLLALFLFSLGGGVVVGLLGLACWLASPRGVGWSLAVVVLGVILFVLFVWPTPYKYYRIEDKNHLLKVNRLSGTVNLVPSSP